MEIERPDPPENRREWATQTARGLLSIPIGFVVLVGSIAWVVGLVASIVGVIGVAFLTLAAGIIVFGVTGVLLVGLFFLALEVSPFRPPRDNGDEE